LSFWWLIGFDFDVMILNVRVEEHPLAAFLHIARARDDLGGFPGAGMPARAVPVLIGDLDAKHASHQTGKGQQKYYDQDQQLFHEFPFSSLSS
jgi:hypothetical protein